MSSHLGGRGRGEGGGADLLRVLDPSERPIVLVVWGSAHTATIIQIVQRGSSISSQPLKNLALGETDL